MDVDSSEPVDFQQLGYQVGSVFTPNVPIGEKEMFSGRKDQIRKVIDVIFQKGQHAIIFGDRGVGKTSLANVISYLIPAAPNSSGYLSERINCDATDDFSSVWKKVFGRMKLTVPKEGIGFNSEPVQHTFAADTLVQGRLFTPESVKSTLDFISKSSLPIVIIDEFDRLGDKDKRIFADLVKTLSDHSSNATVILIGVGESVEQIIKEHESIARAMVQINMPRMAELEIKDIIELGLAKLNMKIEDKALFDIASVSKGLPYYAHLIGKHSARKALDDQSLLITSKHLQLAVQEAIKDAQHSILTTYHSAVRSTKKISLFSDVILACALAEVNELGEFAAQDLRQPMKSITQKPYEITAFARHLDKFCSASRGNILIKSGTRKLFRYKFRDPLMQSFVIMQGISQEKITL